MWRNGDKPRFREILYKMIIPKGQRNENMFKQIIDGIPVYPGVFMLRTQLLFDRLEARKIYFNKEAGQNYQLLLPVAYDNKCGFIDDILYNYYVRRIPILIALIIIAHINVLM